MTPGQLWRLSRPPTLAASIVPVAVGTAAGALAHPPAWPLVGLMAAVALMLQAATNMMNEYHDYARGVDEEASVGIAGVLVRAEVAPASVRRAFVATLALAVASGLLLAWARGPLLLALGAGGVAVAYLYNAGPLPISATPLGEVTVFVVMGVVEVLASEVAAVGRATRAGWMASLTVAALVAVILLANNLRDREIDRRHGRRTLAILLGPRAGAALGAALVAMALVWPAVAAAAGWLPWPCAATLLAVPAGLRFARSLLSDADPRTAVPRAARLELVAGGWLALGLAAAAISLPRG
ncbi:MAG: 1,4-dihydroxy-2-naphthoate octaprenyltransferase [Firmicutes bacterium]|nr:1,4-dihydroxy-2-naphthoate octaprenyltransferase [Bacillota bacterium]